MDTLIRKNNIDKYLPWHHPDLTKVWRWPIARYLNTFGWWSEDYTRPSVKFLFRVIKFTFLAVNVVYLISLTIGVHRQLQSTTNFMDNMFAFFAATPSYLGAAKIFALIIQRRELRRIWKNLDDLLKDVLKRGVDDKLDRELRWRMKRCWLMYSIFLTVGSCITLHWLLRPLVYAMYGERTSIVSTWPSYLENWPLWFATYVFQAMNISSVGHALYIYDNVYFCICENILIHFAIVKHHLHEMDISTGKPGGITMNFCISHHIRLTSVCMDLRECSKYVIMQQVFWTIFIICPAVFELISGRQTDTTIVVNLLEITTIMTCILFLYSWYSNEVTLQSSQIYNTCYMSDWVQGTASQRKTLMTMMTRSMKPIIFGGLVNVDLGTFISVLKTTFSYYQFLDTMDKNKRKLDDTS
uniref:Odorant receptor n=1 Tax=Adelphocoris lineolatus TaxID=236346 RepID=A0A2I4PH90_ADELI|nr:olfactory receptor 77 [Adelphocoris lineolatus]